MQVSFLFRLLHLPKPILLEIVTWKLLQFVPVLGLLVVIHADSFQAVIVYVVLVHPLDQFLELLSSVKGLVEVDEQSQAVFEGIVVSVYSVENEQCVLKLASVVEDIRPFQQDLAKDTALVMLDLLRKLIGSRQGIQSIVLFPLPQQTFRLIEIVIHLIIQLSVRHSLHLRSGEVQHIDLEDQFAVGWDQGDSFLHPVCILWRYHQPQLFVFSYFLQAQLQALDQPFPSYKKLGDFAALTADYLCPINQKHIDLAVNSHAFLNLTPRSISQSILNHMKGHDDFLNANQAILRQTRIISILLNMVQHIIYEKSHPD